MKRLEAAETVDEDPVAAAGLELRPPPVAYPVVERLRAAGGWDLHLPSLVVAQLPPQGNLDLAVQRVLDGVAELGQGRRCVPGDGGGHGATAATRTCARPPAATVSKANGPGGDR